ncbi:MAG: CDP-alcohol phosphatidyltransferase family protein [Myxococcota bacterium]
MPDPVLPPLRSLLKSREVEDPVNVYVHRPLAYAFVWAVYRTPVTPNAVTLLAMLVGLTAGGLWIWGAPGAMLAGGILLWASAILDGADGILARAKRMQSDFGRALDGSADMIVAAGTVLPAFYHIFLTTDWDPVYVVGSPFALVLTLVHLYMYDYYKESYLRMTRLDRGGEGQDASAVKAKLEAKKGEMGPITRLAVIIVLLPFLNAQTRMVALTNPLALREGRRFVRNEETAHIYRTHNAGPMRLWAAISLAPHSYLMAICGMADRLDLYFWIRLVGMNVLWLAVLVWQRRATRRTMEELREIGAVPPAVAQEA